VRRTDDFGRFGRALAAAAVLAAAAAFGGAKPILVFNEDDTHALVKAPAAAYVAYFDSVCRGAVTHFFMCPNAMRSNVDSQAFEPIWRALDEKGVDPKWAGTAKWLHDNGIDPYAIWSKRAREKGVSPWLTMRMNDIHGVDDPSWPSLCTLWREHPECRCDPDYRGEDWYPYAFDYSHEAVRTRALGYIRELLAKYDVDGIECDWLRFPWHFPLKTARAKAPYLTAFMAEVRKIAEAAGQKRRRKVLVGARVPSNLEDSLDLGMDAVAWCRTGSVDWLVPCNFCNSVDFDLDYAGWRKAVEAVCKGVTIVPGLDTGLQPAGHRTPSRYLTLAEYLGWCETQYAQGAPGVYLFNFFQHKVEPRGDPAIWEAGLDGALSPDGVASAKVRGYPISYRDCPYLWRPGIQTGPLDKGKTLVFRIGKTPAAGRCEVRLETKPRLAAVTLAKVTLNGVAAEGGVSGVLTFPLSALKDGRNRLAVPPADATLDGAELFIVK